MISRLFRIPYSVDACGIVLGFSAACMEKRAEFPQNVWKKYVKISNNITTYCVEKRVEGPIDTI
jgi:hypothetical protein